MIFNLMGKKFTGSRGCDIHDSEISCQKLLKFLSDSSELKNLIVSNELFWNPKRITIPPQLRCAKCMWRVWPCHFQAYFSWLSPMAVSSFLFPTQHQGHIMSDTTLILINGFSAIVTCFNVRNVLLLGGFSLDLFFFNRLLIFKQRHLL